MIHVVDKTIKHDIKLGEADVPERILLTTRTKTYIHTSASAGASANWKMH